MAKTSGKTVINITDWRQLATLEKSHATGKHVQVKVKREAIPIIFVPGIMGTRLGSADKLIWDPDDTSLTGTMAWNFYFSGGATRKKLLIDQPLYPAGKSWEDGKSDKTTTKKLLAEKSIDPNWRWFTQRNMTREQTVERLRAQGWGEPAWSFYGTILLALSNMNMGDLGWFFDFPVYACGYNWVLDNTVSGNELTGRIQGIIKQEAAERGGNCYKVIIVTHSMGGLVARWAIVKAGAEAISLGAIHGAQPVTGAPVAYRRMRAGFEGSGSDVKVEGDTAAKVIAVLGNAAGGLELLPTFDYVTNDKPPSKQWLTMTSKDNKSMAPPLPGAGAEAGHAVDPYETIYDQTTSAPGAQPNAATKFLGLVQDGDLLDPDHTTSLPADQKYPGPQTHPAYKKFKVELGKAKAFHQALGLSKHKQTAFSYVNSGNTTVDHITYSFKAAHVQPVSHWYKSGTTEEKVDLPTGQGTDLGPGDTYFHMNEGTSAGDTTVPTSSATALSGAFATKAILSALTHSKFYTDGLVQQFTADCIGWLTQGYLNAELGQLGKNGHSATTLETPSTPAKKHK